MLAFQMGEMSSYQKRGVITLIAKKTKKRALLDNWKPISLLNTNFKIATKARIAARISKVLAFLINGDQTSFVKKGRSIAQIVRLMADIIESTECQA